MFNPEDLKTLYSFLKNTSEQNLRRMFCDGSSFTEDHFRLLMKIVKNSTVEQFVERIEKNEIPKIKLSAKEIGMKEDFWMTCINVFESRGLISTTATPKAA